MNYEKEISKYKRMYDTTDPVKHMTRRLIASHINNLMRDRQRAEGGVLERFEPEFSFAKPEFKIPIIEGRGLPPRDKLFLDGWSDYQ